MQNMNTLQAPGELHPLKLTNTLALIGGKWQLAILGTLGKAPLRYRQLLASLPGISQKVLSEDLKRLTDLGAVERTVYQQMPMWVEYSLQQVLALIAHIQTVEASFHTE